MASSYNDVPFHSRGIRDALSRVGFHFEKLKIRLDQISSDIKNLEEYLRQSAVLTSFKFPLVSWAGAVDEDNCSLDSYFNQHDESKAHICWDIYGNTESYRLLVVFETWVDEFDQRVPQTRSKLLSSVKVPLRIKAHSILPDFLMELSTKVAVEDRQIVDATTVEDFDEEEIPF